MPAKPTHRFEIFSTTDGQTISAVLHKLLKDQSWKQVKQLLSSRRVQVNGNLCVDEGRRLKKGDVLRIFEHSLAAPPSASDITVHFLDEHLLVVDKPAGINTQRHAEERGWASHRKEKMPTLEEWLPRILAGRIGGPKRANTTRARRGRPGRVRSTRPTVRAVHRLDRDTSGLMVFALTPEAQQELVRLFSKHDIDRVYRAVAHGRVEPMRIESRLIRDRGDGLRGSLPSHAPANPQARNAITHVRPIEHLGDTYTLVECRLETGRTHQIRIHLAERGHMICGEKMYCRRPDGSSTPDQSGAPRQALHASHLGFVHPVTGRKMRFDSRWPVDLTQWFKNLKHGAG
jgi:23S rRNA pseudouridine1911/1915/1917 synthase